MFSKIIFVLATVCVVNASVIANNVFDDEISDNTLSDLEELVSLTEDDPGIEVANNPKGCNYRECDQRCRRLKYPGGACINGRCKCDLFFNTDGAVSESNVADSVPSRACNNNRCNQLCRKKKFRGGACVGANCYCHKFLSLLEDEVSDGSLPVSNLLEDQTECGCNMQACDLLCRKLKHPGGTCVNGRCKCDNFFGTEDAVDEYSEDAPRRVCRLTKCSRKCTRRGFEGGVCDNDRCKCYNKTQAEDEISETSLPVSELSEDKIERGCNMRACEQLCRSLKYSGGVCVNGRCKCDNFFRTEDAVDEYSEDAPRRVCRLTKCSRKCTRRGFEGGVCDNDRCKCYNKTQAEDEFSETSLPVSELSEDKTERGCNMRECEQLCRSLKYSGGVCVNGRCKCDNFFGTEDAVDEYSELATRRVCDLTKCNRTCTRRGYEVARCVNGRCKCYNKIQRQDTSPLNDVPSAEIEESNVIIRTNEEELIVTSPRACNTVNCNQMCHRLNYAGGWCRFGKCQCY